MVSNRLKAALEKEINQQDEEEAQVNKIKNPELNKYIETLIAKKQRGKKYRKNKCA